jgi:flagellar biosynthesis protein FlhF
MDLRTFQAATMSEALAQVKSSMGVDAVILHTRTIYKNRWLGLRRREIVEITAGRGLRVADRSSRRPMASSQPAPAQNQAALAAYARPPNSGATAATATVTTLAPSRNPVEAGRQLLNAPAAQNATMLGLTQDMTALKTMVEDLVKHARRQKCPEVPEELHEFYSQMIQSHVAEEIAGDIIKTLQKQIRPEHSRNPEYIHEKLCEQIERLLPSAGPIVRTRAVGPHIVALIGPTGVGKTTTIAKLAANLKIREKRRVGLITIDTYRIAAIDQLRKYAEIIGSPIRAVGTPEDLTLAIESMADCEYILIDTAGRSPKDTLKLNELKTFLAAANPDEVHLVLSTTASQECAELAIERFGDVRVDKIIFTKLDEASHVGVVLNVMKKVNKCLSYVTTGQDVPDDIEVGKGRRLAQMILGKLT